MSDRQLSDEHAKALGILDTLLPILVSLPALSEQVKGLGNQISSFRGDIHRELGALKERVDSLTKSIYGGNGHNLGIRHAVDRLERCLANVEEEKKEKSKREQQAEVDRKRLKVALFGVFITFGMGVISLILRLQ